MILAIAAVLPRVAARRRAARDGHITSGPRSTRASVWRLVTAHLVHLGWGHLWPNLAALALDRATFRRRRLRRSSGCFAASRAARRSTPVLYVFDTESSGTSACPACCTASWLAARCCCLARRQRRRRALGHRACARSSRSSTGRARSRSPQASVGGPVLVAAHLYGRSAARCRSRRRRSARRSARRCRQPVECTSVERGESGRLRAAILARVRSDPKRAYGTVAATAMARHRWARCPRDRRIARYRPRHRRGARPARRRRHRHGHQRAGAKSDRRTAAVRSAPRGEARCSTSATIDPSRRCSWRSSAHGKARPPSSSTTPASRATTCCCA